MSPGDEGDVSVSTTSRTCDSADVSQREYELVYDASTTRQLYRTPLSHDDAVAFIMKGRGTHFDPDVVDAFLQVSPTFRELSTLELV